MKKTVSIIIILVIFLASIIFAYGVDSCQYNQGSCKKCDGQYELFDTELHKDDIFTTYYYKCNNCNHTVRTNFSME